VVQGLLMGTVVSVLITMLVLLQFLNHPFHTGIGGLRPDAMRRTLVILDEELQESGRTYELPCDSRGNAL